MVTTNPLQVRAAEHSVLGFSTRHLGHQRMTTDTALGVTKRVIIDRGYSFFLPTLFPQQLADCVIRSESGRHLCPMQMTTECHST